MLVAKRPSLLTVQQPSTEHGSQIHYPLKCWDTAPQWTGGRKLVCFWTSYFAFLGWWGVKLLHPRAILFLILEKSLCCSPQSEQNKQFHSSDFGSLFHHMPASTSCFQPFWNKPVWWVWVKTAHFDHCHFYLKITGDGQVSGCLVAICTPRWGRLCATYLLSDSGPIFVIEFRKCFKDLGY